MSNELQRLTNYSGAGNQNVSMHFLQKEELDWFLASTADTFCQQQLFRRYKALRKEFDKRHDEVYAQWAAAREELTSVEFWKWYLEDQASS